MCYIEHMDTTIRNLDPDAYRRLKAHAALHGRTVGDVLNEAIRTYLAGPARREPSGSLADWKPVAFLPGEEHLSEEIDRVVYGAVRSRRSRRAER